VIRDLLRRPPPVADIPWVTSSAEGAVAVRTPAVCAIALLACGPAAADEPKRFVERTPYPRIPDAHTHANAGTDCGLRKHARPGIEKHEMGGYVGGSGLVRGEGRGPCEGTFGWDYVGFGRRPGRIFLGFLYDQPRQTLFYPKYNADKPKVKDVVAAAPIKRAVKEAKLEKHEGGGHNGEGH
jgi:hypothetical protein